MEKAAIDEVEIERNPMDVHAVRRPVSQALGFSDFAMNYFELEPGDSFSGGLHTHHDQEEVFYVQKGVATFEAAESKEAARESGGPDEIVVRAGEVIRFAPGEFQMGYNDGDERVVGFAFGAPDAKHDWSEIESLVYCQECGDETGHGLEFTDDGAFRLTCTKCGNAFTHG
jgi:uncharacterized cupin superfamily protein